MDIEYFMKLQNANKTKNKREKELVKVNKQMSKHFDDTFDTEDVLLNGKPFQLMIIKDTDGKSKKKIEKMKPLILDYLPLTLEEVFIYEMEALGYEFNKFV